MGIALRSVMLILLSQHTACGFYIQYLIYSTNRKCWRETLKSLLYTIKEKKNLPRLMILGKQTLLLVITGFGFR